ncbi:Rossmann-like and DUF2520 domain-containing protein [Acinetobacter faecalis]|uniref:Rossmann-like and DUF2520 domain-containing protein n=1 Tax=Acinetobacter faecalis TaxID=2665161 RepID=A0AB35UTV2_9GAMM|nr:Rossmann-like and DUF2520 domain-containing protein [Acinetobacter faecalis]MDY6487211.1 Rossmann-like and DUF2520 domain-containing protein [Acinetobacter faecalis]MDY6509934.1 Rossmann-like and DUF2520 domain-containing protein [Acinetobacter faecalis]
MRISFIGAGRVAYHLAKALGSQHQVVQIYSRTFEKAEWLSLQVQAQAISNFENINTDIDLMIIAVSDQSIKGVIEQISPYLKDVCIVHTSGSTHLNVLAKTHDKCGVFYPLQTFSLEREIDWENTPLFIEAANKQDLENLVYLANSLSNKVYSYNSEQRLSLHLAAIFACNFSNYCYDMAKQIVAAKHVDFSLLYPLIQETANKALANNPKDMQTGPAMRGDENIIQMHQEMLKQEKREDLQEVYALLSQQIIQRHTKL